VDDHAAAEVEHAPLLQKPAAPDPVGQRHVDQQAPGREEDEVARKRHAVGESAGDQGRRQGRHRELEDEEGQEGDSRRVLRVGSLPDVVQEKVVQVADDAVDVGPEGQAEATDDPDKGHDAEADEALHHDGDDVLASHEAAVEKGQARRHDRYECDADENEGGVARVDLVHEDAPSLQGPARRVFQLGSTRPMNLSAPPP
jgi:hypothetical protein